MGTPIMTICARHTPSADDLKNLRDLYTALLQTTIALSRLAKRVDQGRNLEVAGDHLNEALSAIDAYRARVL